MARKKSAARKLREAEAEAKKQLEESKPSSSFLEDNDNGDNDDIDTLNINQEYAKRFEHNKSREERHRSEEKEKYKKIEIEDEESDESSSDEDDFGELLTEDIDQGIQKVLEAIRKDPKELLNPEAKFFPDPDSSNENNEKSSKAMYLKDYHRKNLLDGKGEVVEGEEDDEEEKPYAIQQREDRAKLLAEINKDDDEDDDDFLTKRDVQRTVEAIDLPNPDQDSGKFLEAYINGKAWIPSNIDKKTGKEILPSYNDIVANEDDEDFEDIADEFETAYNFRYEDPNAAEIVSYARNQSTLRRKEENSRKKAREQKAELKKEEEAKKKAEINKLKKVKVNEVVSKFQKLKEVIEDDETAARFENMDILEGDFDASEWDKRMEQIFNEEFYSKKDKKIAKEEKADEEDEEEKEEEEEEEDAQLDDPRRSRKDKHDAKKEKQRLKQLAEQFVEKNLDLALEDENIDALPSTGTKFKYRDVSPDSYGLTSRDILLADDKQLNEFVGLKKLASFRDDDKKKHDRRKYAKKRRLREWRKSVFQTEDEPADELFDQMVNSESQSKPSKRQKRK